MTTAAPASAPPLAVWPLSDPYAKPRIGRTPKYELTEAIRTAIVERYVGTRISAQAIGDEFGDIPFWKITSWARELNVKNREQPHSATERTRKAAPVTTRIAETEAATPTATPAPIPALGDAPSVDPSVTAVTTPAPEQALAIETIPPLLRLLLDRLPRQQTWRTEERQRWVRAWVANLDLLIAVEDGEGDDAPHEHAS